MRVGRLRMTVKALSHFPVHRFSQLQAPGAVDQKGLTANRLRRRGREEGNDPGNLGRRLGGELFDEIRRDNIDAYAGISNAITRLIVITAAPAAIV